MGSTSVILESRDVGPNCLLPLEVAMFSAFSGVLRDGTNPLRWIIVHEMVKQGLHELVAPYLVESGTDVRHFMTSYLFETQKISFLPTALVGLATGIIHFKGIDQQDYRRLQELFCAFQHLPFKYISELPDGVAFMAFLKVSDPQLANRVIKVYFRPSATWAGGETMRVR